MKSLNPAKPWATKMGLGTLRVEVDTLILLSLVRIVVRIIVFLLCVCLISRSNIYVMCVCQYIIYIFVTCSFLTFRGGPTSQILACLLSGSRPVQIGIWYLNLFGLV